VADARVAAHEDVRERLRRVRDRHREVLLIVGPPRTASTALARVLWNHPDVGFYSHEPFEPTYYRNAPSEIAAELLEAPAPVAELNPARAGRGHGGSALLIKEMTFQVGDRFPLLTELSTRPVVFLIRDPRLTVASRMEVLRRSGRPEVFPLRESGWEDLRRQIAHVRNEGIPHLVVDSRDFRKAPERVVPALLATLGLAYSSALLRWESSAATGLSSVSGAADPFYQRVLESHGIEAPKEQIPALSHFPEQGGFRDHVAECVETYEALRAETMAPTA
jgi:hypothetical protein